MVSGVPDSTKANHLVTGIFMKYGSFIRKIIRQNLTNLDMGEDLFHNLFLHLRTNPMPVGIENIEKYLYRAVINCIADKRRQGICYEAFIEEYAETVSIAQTEPAPETQIIDAEETAKTFALIRRHLTHKEFLAIDLRYRDNCSICETARVMNIEAESVTRYITRAFEKLRSSLIWEEVFAAHGYGRRSRYPNRGAASLAAARSLLAEGL